MADVVHYRLERMIPELEDLDRRGLFSKREIDEIVKARKKFEYRLKRPSPLKKDFIAYIEYEKQLDALRILRKKSMSRESKGKGNKKSKKSFSDFAGVRRIIEIYRMATSRFKGDLELWFQYLEFCRERNNGRMKKALAQVIRFHPKVPAVWIYAAAWEFDHNLNAAAARAIMQSGLRSCPNSEDLWVEYLRMELTYLNKLKTRKVILGEDVGTLVRDNKDADEQQWKEENQDLFMSIEEQEEDANESDVQNGVSDKKLDLFKEQGYSILCTVYKGAIEALPSCLSLRKRFLEILEATDLAHSEDMRNKILSDMKRDFSGDPEYWDWLAKLKIHGTGSTFDLSVEAVRNEINEAVQVYEGALKTVPSALMFDMYIKFLMDVITPITEVENSGNVVPSNHVVPYISHILEVFEAAETTGCLTAEIAYEHVSFCLLVRKFHKARKLAEKFCEGKFSDATQLWVLRVTIEMKWVTRKPNPSKDELSSVYELLRRALTRVTISDAESLWVMALKFFAHDRSYSDKLLDLSLISLARDGGSENGFSLASAIVDFVLQKDGIQKARDLYKRIIALPHPGLAIYRHCIELESNLASIGEKDGLVNARKLFESALSTYVQDINLWRDYYSMETKMGTSETANGVYWRAKKALSDAITLIAPNH